MSSDGWRDNQRHPSDCQTDSPSDRSLTLSLPPMTTRRDFLKTGAAAGALALTAPALARAEALAQHTVPSAPPPMDPAVKELLTEALNAAELGGAEFADARIGRYRNNFVITREQQIINVVDTDNLGVGVRV